MIATMNLSMQSGGFHPTMKKAMRMNGKSGTHISSITCFRSMVPIRTSIYPKYCIIR
jgi:hypothetical protein